MSIFIDIFILLLGGVFLVWTWNIDIPNLGYWRFLAGWIVAMGIFANYYKGLKR